MPTLVNPKVEYVGHRQLIRAVGSLGVRSPQTLSEADRRVSVNVVFFGGADFDPPPPLGTTDRTRYIKVATLEEAQRPELHEWIEQAGRTPGWK